MQSLLQQHTINDNKTITMMTVLSSNPNAVMLDLAVRWPRRASGGRGGRHVTVASVR